MVMAIFFVVDGAPGMHRPTPETLAISLGARTSARADRVLSAMRARGIIGEDNRPTLGWATAGRVTMSDAEVTRGDGRLTAAVTRPLTGAERTRRYKARKRAEKLAIGEASAQEQAAPLPAVTSASLSFFPQQHIVEEERKKKTRARADDGEALDTEFDAFMVGWPASTPLEPARRAYRAARRSAEAVELIAGRDRYVATKPDWQNWCSAAKFLNEKRWLQPGCDQTEMLMPISGGHSRRPGSFVTAIRAAADAGPLRTRDASAVVELRRNEAQDLGEAGARLMQHIGQVQFQAWFAGAVLVGVRDDTVHLAVPRAFIRSRVREQYEHQIAAAWRVSNVNIEVADRGTQGPRQRGQ